jgi:C4-dicarboxylate-specific signal transduction histidine kinase
LSDALQALQALQAETANRARVEEFLRQAQKMETVGQLTGGLAHDFNNILTGIQGSLELLRLRLSQGRMNDLDRHINTASTAADRATALTQRLLAFARQQTLDAKAIRANDRISGMEDLIRRTIGPSITLKTWQLYQAGSEFGRYRWSFFARWTFYAVHDGRKRQPTTARKIRI